MPEMVVYMLHILRAYEDPAWREYYVKFRQLAQEISLGPSLTTNCTNQCSIGRARQVPTDTRDASKTSQWE